MKSTIFLVVCFTVAGFAVPQGQASPPAEGAKKKAAPQAKSARLETMTGCVDQQEGNFVLLDDRMEKKLADLEAVGASNEAFFAKHVGHTVTVKGKKSSEQEGKFKVSSIEDKAPVCAPAESTNPR